MSNISIIIPTLNEESVIERTLKPLQAMRDNGIEVIVVDGGSRDQTTTKAESYTDQLITALRLDVRLR